MYREGGPIIVETLEQRRRRLQLQIGVAWKKREITNSALRERGFAVSATDAEDYHAKRARHHAMKNVSYGVLAENMLLEGADMDGLTDQEPYHWFGPNVLSYPPCEIDDVLRGVDAILMFMDEEDERVAHPLAIDVKTNPDDATSRMADTLEDVARRRYFENVYWVDTASEPGATSFDEPAPVKGKIRALKLALYIPAESAKIYEDESRTAAVADREMRRLGETVRHQLASQLEAMALIVLGKVRFDDVARGYSLSRFYDQDGLRAAIQAGLGQDVERDRLLGDIANNLEAIWEQQRESGDSDNPKHELMPSIIRSLGQAKRSKKRS